LQTLARHKDVGALTAGYGLIVADECHHVPAAAFEHAVKQIPARRWLGLTATPYRRDKLDDLIYLQVGPVRHTIAPHIDRGRDADGQAARLEFGTGEAASGRLPSCACTRQRSATPGRPSHPLPAGNRPHRRGRHLA
jgi:hypothetical protein